MKIGRILQPGRPGTKKLLERYGDNLICVRYRYDEERGRVLKTIEIIVDEKPWSGGAPKPSQKEIVSLRIAVDELELRRRVKSAGGKWDSSLKAWRLPYEKAAELGLVDRIIDDEHS